MQKGRVHEYEDFILSQVAHKYFMYFIEYFTLVINDRINTFIYVFSYAEYWLLMNIYETIRRLVT